MIYKHKYKIMPHDLELEAELICIHNGELSGWFKVGGIYQIVGFWNSHAHVSVSTDTERNLDFLPATFFVEDNVSMNPTFVMKNDYTGQELFLFKMTGDVNKLHPRLEQFLKTRYP